jgi:hypothetical protein
VAGETTTGGALAGPRAVVAQPASNISAATISARRFTVAVSFCGSDLEVMV